MSVAEVLSVDGKFFRKPSKKSYKAMEEQKRSVNISGDHASRRTEPHGNENQGETTILSKDRKELR